MIMMNSLKKWFLMIPFCAAMTLAAQNAVITETLVLDDGSKLLGYTTEQSPTKGIEFRIVKIVQDSKSSYKEESTRLFEWDKIKRIETKEKEALQLSGINLIVSFKDGKPTVKGSITSQTPEGEIMFTDTDGAPHEFKSGNIASIKKEKANACQDIWEQVPLIEVVVPKEKTAYPEGIIIEKNYASKEGAFMIILSKDGSTDTVKWANLQEIQYKINPEYNPMFDAEVSDGAIFFLGDEIKFDPIDNSKPLEFSCSHSPATLEIPKDSLDNGHLKFKATSKQQQGFVIVPVEKVEKQTEDNPKKSDKKKKEESDDHKEVVCCQYKISSFFSTRLSTNISDPTPRNTRTYSFDMNDDEGLFALIRLEKKEVILINITK